MSVQDTKKKIWKFVGVDFSHMHIYGLMNQVHACSEANLVGIADRQRNLLLPAQTSTGLSDDDLFDDFERMLDERKPDVAVICSSPDKHGDYVEKITQRGIHCLVEKPMAASLTEADRIIAVWKQSGVKLAINWPMRWYPTLVTAYRSVQEGIIGKIQQVNYRNGNQGPGYIGRKLTEPPPSKESLVSTWFWRKPSGGIINDYIGYGTTLMTWYLNGKTPIEVNALATNLRGTEVEDNVVAAVKYDDVFCRLEATWTSLTSPWEIQPQPPHGFVLVGERGSISAYDYFDHVRVATLEHPEGYDVPCDKLLSPNNNPIEYFVDCLNKDCEPEGPLNPDICRIGQAITEAVKISSDKGRTVALKEIL